MKNSKRHQKGFTIIEVMIVLVIAAIILLMVFVAVPALQRNSRNTQRKADVGRIGAATTEFVSGNNGTLPAASNASVANSDAQKIGSNFGTLSYYTFAVPANFIVETQSVVAANTVANSDQVRVVTNAQCDTSAGNQGKVVSGNARQMAIQFATETAASTQPQCQNI